MNDWNTPITGGSCIILGFLMALAVCPAFAAFVAGVLILAGLVIALGAVVALIQTKPWILIGAILMVPPAVLGLAMLHWIKVI